MSSYLDIQTKDHILHLRLNRAEKKNALDLAMYQTLADHINEANSDDNIRVILISAEGDAFCSGNDLKDFMQNPPRDTSSSVFQFIHALANGEKPMVAAVNGLAVGIGTTMLLHCDLVYASEEAVFSLPFVNLGLCIEAGASLLLPRLCGHQKAAELTLTGQSFDVNEADKIGLITEVTTGQDLMQTALDSCKRMAQLPANSVQTTRLLLKAPVQAQLMEAIRNEAEKFIGLLQQDEARQILQGFLSR